MTSSTVTCPPDSTLTYENFGQLVIGDNCLQCHTTSKDKPFLDTQAGIQNAAKAIIEAAVTNTSMPKGNSMVDGERQMLGEWLACGAP